MSQESDRILYIEIRNLSRNRPEYYHLFRTRYQSYLEDIESRYDEDTFKKWREEAKQHGML